MDAVGRRPGKARLPEGVAGTARLHAMIAEQAGDAADDEVEVLVGIETDRGPWVLALVAAGYTVFAVNPSRAGQRLRHALREYFPAALTAVEALELPATAPDPASAAKLTLSQISATLKRARRRGDLAARAGDIQAALRAEHLGQPAMVTAAYAVSDRALVAVLALLGEQVTTLQGQVEEGSGDDRDRYASAKTRKNYAGTSPITRASGKKRSVLARFVHNDRLIDALMTQASVAQRVSPGARASYDKQRARGVGYNTALRQLANRLVGILHGCLKTGTLYDEATAWSHHVQSATA
ncbi:transposase [Nonomuraea sp. NPDC049709]|uniref:transposase n=1 Tax=Nonomuraea sp. NPDC049709 TaxID=3154736 RepID=UPI0034215134